MVATNIENVKELTNKIDIKKQAAFIGRPV